LPNPNIVTEKEFTGKTALVTGGSRGIGRAISLKLARNGANIAINYMSRDADAVATKEAVEKEGVRCALVKGDISSPEAMASVTARTREALGPISLLVANAAISLIESHNEISFETWRKTMSVNLDGTFLSVMAVKDEMLAQNYGRIVCISSIAALRPRKMQIHYASSKAALSALVRCCAEAFAPHVRVNCIAPGLIETEMGAMIGPAVTKSIIEATPLARLGRPEEIANAVHFLLSDQSSFMTGQTIAVSGGRVMLP
jgi:NAD(P)-dependent dehydrogenase (short-subunit alcohol dehydrogenase family)